MGVIPSLDVIRNEVIRERKKAEADDYQKLRDKNKATQVNLCVCACACVSSAIGEIFFNGTYMGR